MLTKDERAGLEKKLETCRDPSTRDLVKAFAAMKQGAGDGSDAKAQRSTGRRGIGGKAGWKVRSFSGLLTSRFRGSMFHAIRHLSVRRPGRPLLLQLAMSYFVECVMVLKFSAHW